MKKEILCLEKVYIPPFLENLNLHILEGEIVGLIPINILGVDELVTLIGYGYPLHYGYVSYDGKVVNDYLDPNPKKNNVLIIDKETTLIDSLSVYENLFVIRKGFAKHLINKKMLIQQTQMLLIDLDIKISPNVLVENLSLYEKVALELIKAQILCSKLVILKDISSFINEKDIEKLHNLMRKISKKGISFLYICNHHQEAFLISERCYLMKEGHMVKNLLPNEMTDKVMEYYSYVFEHSLSTSERLKLYDNKEKPSDIIFSVKHVFFEKLKNLSFDLHKGETIVLFDSDNSIIESLSKLLKVEDFPNKGQILLNNKWLKKKDRKIALIDKKPLESNIFYSLSVMDNILFCADHKLKNLWFNHKIEKAISKSLFKDLGNIVFEKDLKKLNEAQLFEVLHQKILFQKPDLLVLIQPFAFLDMYQRLNNIEYYDKLKKNGVSILILALSISDTLQVADRLYFASEGKIINSYLRKDFSLLSHLHGSLPQNKL